MDNILKSKQYYQNFISILDILLNEILSQYCQPLFTMEVEGDVAKKKHNEVQSVHSKVANVVEDSVVSPEKEHFSKIRISL